MLYVISFPLKGLFSYILGKSPVDPLAAVTGRAARTSMIVSWLESEPPRGHGAYVVQVDLSGRVADEASTGGKWKFCVVVDDA